MPVYGFNKRRTAQAAAALVRQNPPSPYAAPLVQMSARTWIVRSPAGGIPAIVDATPGVANCKTFVIDPEAPTLQQESGQATDTPVYNIGDEIPEDKYVLGQQVGAAIVVMGAAEPELPEDICEILCEQCEQFAVPDGGCRPFEDCCYNLTPDDGCAMPEDPISNAVVRYGPAPGVFEDFTQVGPSIRIFPGDFCRYRINTDLGEIFDFVYWQNTIGLPGNWEAFSFSNNLVPSSARGATAAGQPCGGSIASFPWDPGGGVPLAFTFTLTASDCPSAATAEAQAFHDANPGFFIGCKCKLDVLRVLDRWTPGAVTLAQMQRVAATISNKNPAVDQSEVMRALKAVYQ